MTTLVHSETVLGKRVRASSLVLHLSSSPEPRLSSSSSSSQKKSTGKPILVNGALVPSTNKRYACTYDGCQKSYSKPSRLAEHERSHTGNRPFVCESCNKSYLRETHLQAHARSHLPESSRPLVCPRDGCTKRFWTSQHLRVHIDWHNGSKSCQCPKDGCEEAFAKNYQLRAHICEVHSPSGANPWKCDHGGCTKTFSTKQHLRTHSKVHDERRYACIHPTCLPGPESNPVYFSKWTTLQLHTRTAHPPQCAHPSCNGRTFSSQKGLIAHLKLHEHRNLEEEINSAIISNLGDSGDDKPGPKRRRGGEIGRDWKCDVERCEKDFKSKKALTTHQNVTHLGRRDYVCPTDGCQQAFGYKHLLQRHVAKIHSSTSSSTSDESGTGESMEEPNIQQSENGKPCFVEIDMITGKSYAQNARSKVAKAMAVPCPYPYVDEIDFVPPEDSVEEGVQRSQASNLGRNCEYAFSRAYDLRRHLKIAHGLHADKESVDRWVRERKMTARQSLCYS